VYGIGPAAWHYFRTRPSDLTLAQSLYLISILPNPRNHHFRPDGDLSPRWAEYLRKLMHIAHKIRRIDDEDLAAGLSESLRFGMPSELPAEPDLDDPDGGSAPFDVLDLAPDDDARR
jgi:membrane peptidoglycan carboxypeptidase